jgi:precorrin-6A/cobalt-precorrin-6A reductase
MILLLGGTSDAAPLALRLAQAGYRVLVSKATDTPLAVGDHPAIEGRWGPLDDAGLAEVIHRGGIRGLVDATHPYAASIRRRAIRVAASMGIPCVRFERPGVVTPGQAGVELARGHAAAAAAAFAYRRAVLLTTGSTHLAPYAERSRRTGIPFVARVLGDRRSLEACRLADIPEGSIVVGRGPFSVQQNRHHIQAHGIGVLVTKDSGVAGGTREKLEAARIEGCRVVVLRRPRIGGPHLFGRAEALLVALLRLVPPGEAASGR